MNLYKNHIFRTNEFSFLPTRFKTKVVATSNCFQFQTLNSFKAIKNVFIKNNFYV